MKMNGNGPEMWTFNAIWIGKNPHGRRPPRLGPRRAVVLLESVEGTATEGLSRSIAWMQDWPVGCNGWYLSAIRDVLMGVHH